MQNFAFIQMCYCVDKTMSFFCNVLSVKTANQVTLIKTVFQNISIHPATVLKSDCSWCTVKTATSSSVMSHYYLCLPPTSYIVTIMNPTLSQHNIIYASCLTYTTNRCLQDLTDTSLH